MSLKKNSLKWKSDFLDALGAFEDHAATYIEKYPNIFFTTPATPALKKLTSISPERVLDTGINEQHCLTLSTTLASLNHKVIMSMSAIFLSRCYSQIFDLFHLGAPLTIVVNLPGVTPYGSTHQSVYAIGLIKNVPNSTLMHPMNINEFNSMMDYCLESNRPIFLQMSKENISDNEFNMPPIQYGKGCYLTRGDQLTVLPVGSMFEWAFQIADENKEVEIINPRFIKPFDYDILLESLSKTKKLLILEDGLKSGGLGEEVVTTLCERGIDFKFELVAAKSMFPDISGVDYQGIQFEYGLTMNKIRMSANRLLDNAVQMNFHAFNQNELSNMGQRV